MATMLGRWSIRGKDSSLDRIITNSLHWCEKVRIGTVADNFSKPLISTVLASLLGRFRFRLFCRFHKLSLEPDLCALEGLRNDAVRLSQFSLLKKLLLVDPGNLRFSVEVNRGNP